MSEILLDACFKCRSRDSVGFVLVSTNKAGGQVWKIKCEKCGLTSVEESIKGRLAKWWNDREVMLQPDRWYFILKAIEDMEKTLKGKTNKKQLIENLENIKKELGGID